MFLNSGATFIICTQREDDVWDMDMVYKAFWDNGKKR
jgi:hypothetical protein